MSARSRSTTGHRLRIENEMAMKRERQWQHEQTWNNQQKYYKKYEKNNTKFEEWTSPRYYESNTQLMDGIRKEREKRANLERRHEKLKKLLEDDDKLYKIEQMIRSTTAKPPEPDIPVDVLREINLGLKLKAEDRRRHEAELKLYHKWRADNPVLRHYERIHKMKDLKLTWLDQQIEKRMQKDKDEEESRRILKDHDEMMKRQIADEKDYQRTLNEKRNELKAGLDRQLNELEEKKKIADELKSIENVQLKKRFELNEIEMKRQNEEKRRRDRECALYNVKQYKLKLKQKSDDIQKNLDSENELIAKLKEIDLIESIENEQKKFEIKETIEQFLELNRQQKQLEKKRQQRMDFIFDSESKAIYEQQSELWGYEEKARLNLIKDVIETVQEQINDKIQSNHNRQCKLLKEREEMLRKIEDYNRDMEQLKMDEIERKLQRKNDLDKEVLVKNALKKEIASKERSKVADELECIRKEEEKLKREILNIQMKQTPIRPRCTRLF